VQEQLEAFNELAAFDDWKGFLDSIRSQGRDGSAIKEAAVRASNRFAALARTEDSPEEYGGPVVAGAHQTYLDYGFGTLSKISVLEELRREGVCTLWTAVDYDNFASDTLIRRVEFPNVHNRTDTGSYLESIVLHPRQNKFGGSDLRFVPPPEKESIALFGERIKQICREASRTLQMVSPDRERMWQHYEEYMKDISVASEAAANVAEFNGIVTLRMMRRLGFTTPYVQMSELLDDPSVARKISEFYSAVIRDNDAFVSAANSVFDRYPGVDLHSKRYVPGILPMQIAAGDKGKRSQAFVEKREGGHVISSRDLSVGVGDASPDEIQEFLHEYKGRWSPNVAMPLLMDSLGLGGMISGKSSMIYSVPFAEVTDKMFGRKYLPNFFSAGSAAPGGFFHRAVLLRSEGRADADECFKRCEPTILYRMLESGYADVADELRNVWGGD